MFDMLNPHLSIDAAPPQVFDAVAKPITDLHSSLAADVGALRRSPLVDAQVPIYG